MERRESVKEKKKWKSLACCQGNSEAACQKMALCDWPTEHSAMAQQAGWRGGCDQPAAFGTTAQLGDSGL